MKKLPWRTAFYLVALTYLLIDLKCCNGPLKQKIAEIRPSSDITQEKARKLGWVALVNQEPVTQMQLQLAVSRHLYQRGKSRSDVPEKALTRIKRASLRSLIDDMLIRQYADGVDYEAPKEEQKAFVKAWESQFHSPEQMAERTEFQNLTTETRTAKLNRIWSRKRWLEDRISPGIGITEREIKAWFTQNKGNGKFSEPEKVRARHIFISTVEEDGETQETAIKQAHERIVKGESFEEVAREVSEDQRTKDRSGDLNWFSRNRVSEPFAKTVFKQQPNELGAPFKTEIGWHIVEVTEHQPAREAKFEDIKAEIRVNLLNQQKVDKVNELLGKLRKVANILVFTKNL